MPIALSTTKIHVDRVVDLGDFLELEVVLQDDENPEVGAAEAAALMAQLGVQQAELVAGAYLDLLESQSSSPEPGFRDTNGGETDHQRETCGRNDEK